MTTWREEMLDNNYMQEARIFYEKMAIFSRDENHNTKQSGFTVYKVRTGDFTSRYFKDNGTIKIPFQPVDAVFPFI